jgi:rfaE bifunctional protein nucleotidyltransferase chain/domain
VNFREKILTAEALPKWRAELRNAGRKLVVTNGCFDILHAGHVTYLEAARNLGDALLVGLTRDVHVSALKGPNRPVNCETDRALVIAALESVSAVHLFAERTAEKFLELVQPDIYAKGGDYTIDTINQDERRLVERLGGKVVILPGVPGRSTTALLAKIASL